MAGGLQQKLCASFPQGGSDPVVLNQSELLPLRTNGPRPRCPVQLLPCSPPAGQSDAARGADTVMNLPVSPGGRTLNTRCILHERHRRLQTTRTLVCIRVTVVSRACQAVFTLVTRSRSSLTSASKFNIETNGGIFDVSSENDRASPKVKTLSGGLTLTPSSESRGSCGGTGWVLCHVVTSPFREGGGVWRLGCFYAVSHGRRFCRHCTEEIPPWIGPCSRLGV